MRVEQRSGVFDLRSVKLRALLAVLLLHANSAVHADSLVNRLWDEEGQPEDARKKLQTYVSRARGILKKAKSHAELITEHGHYRLRVEPSLVDYYRFRQLADEGKNLVKNGDHRGAVAVLDEALELWREPPLADVYTTWAYGKRDELVSQVLLPAYRTLFEAHLAQDHHELVLKRLRPLLDEHPPDETFAAQYLSALAVVDEVGSMTSFFHDFTRRMRESLGAQPAEWLVRHYRKLVDEQPLPSAFGVPATAARHRVPPRQLPRDTPHFLGRDGLMRRLDALLVTSNGPALVALDGLPGVGKTALATHWAHSRIQDFPDGDLYADLNGYGPGAPTSPAYVLATFLEALGFTVPADTEERVALLRCALAGRRILVFLDNARDSEHIRPLLAATSPCPVLVTSRQQLTTLAYREGAERITVPPFLIEDAMAFLRHRIGDTQEQLRMTTLHDLATLCAGLPIALQIAGEHIAARPDVPSDDLVAHLRGQLLDAGGHGDGDAPTLRAVFAWSCDALSAEARRLFQFLGLHPSARITTPAAAAVAGLPADEVEKVFGKLIGAHLLHQETGDGYRLHDLLHQYATDRVREREDWTACHDAVHRMVDWYLGTVINALRLIFPQQPEVPPLSLRTAVRPQTFGDKEEAMRWCVRERAQVLEVARFGAEYGFHEHVWRMVGIFGDLLHLYGDPRDLIEIHHVALRSARTVGSRYGEAAHLNNLACFQLNLREYAEAERNYRRSLAIWRESDNLVCEATSLHNIGTTYLERDDFRAAIKSYQAGLDLYEKAGYEAGQARAHLRLGDAYRGLGKHDLAVASYHRELEVRQRSGQSEGRGQTLVRLGELALERGDELGALKLCLESLSLHRAARAHRRAAETLRVLARVRERLGEFDKMLACAREAIRLSGDSCDLRGKAEALEISGRGHHALGQNEESHECWRQAYELYRELGDVRAQKMRLRLEEPAEPRKLIPGQRTDSAPPPWWSDQVMMTQRGATSGD
ncbi:ATP-binding protein [Amycolatopsis anabasis]|uniref:ATP-binding protein n=1 Tax=Amycolatopsis anabasis TaxID=1840409 RepID=UPI00131CCCB7|nr:tetratricopeptide repeat protein [Amycolatopsis anabasis]